jgi:5-methylcytosine-specific restriction endonuclease McrA
MKICKLCKIEKPFEEFHSNIRLKDGHDNRCKDCKKAIYESEKEVVCARQKARRAADPDGIKARNRISQAKYLAKNRDACNARIKKWAQENPDAANSKTRNYVSRKRNAEGTHTSQDIAVLLVKQNGKCKACGVDVTAGYHVDHIVALACGGTNWPSNLQILCPTCNMSKGAKDYEDWLNQG